MLTPQGGVRSELTINRLAPDRFYVVSAAAAERHDSDVMWRALPPNGGVRIDNLTQAWGVLVLAGPKSRDVLRKITDADLSNEKFPWLSGQDITIGHAPVRALRVNFVGELGWELHHPLTYQNVIFDAIMEAGKEFDIKPFGIRAMDSLRIEKSYKYWRGDLFTEYTAWESGLDRFVHLNKGEFTGREALVRQQQQGVPRKFVTVEVDAKESDPWGNEPLFIGKKMVGRDDHRRLRLQHRQEPRSRIREERACRTRHRAEDRDARQAPRRPPHRGLALGSGEQTAAGREKSEQ